MAAWNAARNAATRSAGTPGGARIGRSISMRPQHELQDLLACVSSLVNSPSAGTSGKLRARARARSGSGSSTFFCGNQSGRVEPIDDIKPAAAALDLAALHREIDLVAALVAGDDLHLRAEQLVQHRRQGFHMRAHARAADGELPVEHVLPGLDLDVVPGDADAGRWRRGCRSSSSAGHRTCHRRCRKAGRTARWNAPCR